MAVFDGIRVYGNLKPTLECSLVAGGSLVANAKYYIFGVAKTRIGGIYTPTYGRVSDIYELTTTSTDRSIQIYHKTYRSITQCVDGGSGKLNVTAIRHCLFNNDSIVIPSGIYAGTYSVTTLDYDTFQITKAYAGDYTGQCYTDSAKYNRNQGIIFYISTINPIDAYGDFAVSGNRYTTADFGEPHANGTIYTSQPTSQLYSSGSPAIQGFAGGIFESLLDGTITIELSATKTLYEIRDEVNASGFGCCYRYSVASFNKTLVLAGSIVSVAGSSVSFNFSNTSFLIICGEILIRTENRQTDFSLTSCTFTIYGGMYMNSSNPYMIGGGYAIYGLRGNNQQAMINGAPYSVCADTYAGTAQAGDYAIETVDGLLQVHENKHFWGIKSDSQLNIVYQAAKYKDCSARGVYMNLTSGSNHSTGQVAYYENITMYTRHLTYDIRFHSSAAGSTHVIKCVNIDVLVDPDNIKKVWSYGVGRVEFLFYRKVGVFVREGLNELVGAQITITDNNSTIYTFTTDVNGHADIEVIEQQALVETSPGYSVNTLKGPYTLLISADGYQDYSDVLDRLIDLEIALLPEPLPKPSISSLQITNPGINNNDGSITIIAESGTQPYTYALDDGEYQESDTFTGLSEGTYSVYVKDANNSIDTIEGIKLKATVEIPRLTVLSIVHPSSDNNDGSIVVEAEGGVSPYMYSINSGEYQSEDTFAGLSEGEYLLGVRDGMLNESTLDGVRLKKNEIDDSRTEIVLSGTINNFESEILRHLLFNEDITNIGDDNGLIASSVDGNVYICLLKADPGEEGSIDNEADYTGYSRVAIERGDSGWIEGNGRAYNKEVISFPVCTGGANDIKWFGVCKTSTGDDMMWYGELSSTLYISAGVRPQYNIGQLAISIN